MRIVGGELSGRRFGGKVASATRPTSERVREALASALEARGLLHGARVLDLYAGTGALAFEALSRGARDAWLVESDVAALRGIEGSIRSLDLSPQAHTQRLRLDPKSIHRLRRPPDGAFDLVFADPPYASLDAAVDLLSALPSAVRLAEGAHLVLEHAARDALTLPDHLARVADYRYGDTRVSLLTWIQPLDSLSSRGAPS